MIDAMRRPSRRAISEWTLAQIYEAIFSGAIPRGQPLGEDDLCERLSISRTPVREALRQLEADGLVEVGSGGRRAVAEFGVADIRDIYTVRAALEELAHERAAERLQPAALARLEEITSAMESSPMHSPAERRRFFDLDFETHALVCSAAGSPRLDRLVRPLHLQTRALITHLDAAGLYPTAHELPAVGADHRAILEALASRDGRRAGKAVKRHLESRRDRLAELLEQNGSTYTPVLPESQSDRWNPA